MIVAFNTIFEQNQSIVKFFGCIPYRSSTVYPTTKIKVAGLAAPFQNVTLYTYFEIRIERLSRISAHLKDSTHREMIQKKLVAYLARKDDEAMITIKFSTF